MGDEEIKLCIFDLDGTLIETETLVLAVAQEIVKSHGKQLTDEAIQASIGRRPLDAWHTVIEILDIPNVTPQQLFHASEPILTERWHEARLLPGALRLVTHLRAANIPLALATSTSRQTLQRKLATKPELLEAFQFICCGDDPEVANGKPAPDCFLHVASLAGVHPRHCLVFEDAPCGVTAAVEAGMRVVVVPSHHPQKNNDNNTATTATATDHQLLLPSLLSFYPEQYGLPPFTDNAGDTIPLDPVWRIRGTVVKGFGRGSSQLGIPTANLDPTAIATALAGAVTGIYCGWASLPTLHPSHPFAFCMSVGYNPVFGNKEKTCEPWILHDFEGVDFYGAEIRLVVTGFIRPEADFPSLEALVARIHKDAEVSKVALLHDPRYLRYAEDAFLFEQV